MLPLSGPLAEYGEATYNGFRLGLADYPSLKQSFELAVEDSGYDNKSALIAFEKLRSDSRTRCVYLWGYGPAQAVAPVAERMKFPLIAVTAERRISVGKQHVVRYNFYAEQIGEGLAKYLRSAGRRKVGLVRTEQAFLNGILDGLTAAWPADDSIDTVQVFQSTDRDFASTITVLRQRQYDALGVLLLPGQLARFYRQASAQRLTLSTFGTFYADSDSEIAQSGNTMEGVAFVTPDVTDNFRKRYTARFGNDNSIAFTGSAYDFVALIARIPRESLSSLRGSEAIFRALATATPHSGVSGVIGFVDNPIDGPSFTFPVVLKEIAGGKVVPLMAD